VTPARRPVLIVSNHAEIVGGGEVSLLTLLAGLDRARWDPSLVVPADGAVAAGARDLGIPAHVIPLPGLRRAGAAVCRSVAALRRLALDTGARLLHANGSRAMFYAGVAGRLLGRPVVWHVRVWRADRALDWLLVRLATRSIIISDAVRERFRRWPRAYRECSVVPNGLDLGAFVASRPTPAIRESLGLGPADRVVGCVGRMVEFKGQGHLLDAFATLRRSASGVRLLLVGDGPERPALEDRARRLGIAGEVQFVGHRRDVADLLTVMEVFVLPSLAEDFGRVLLEAMAMERPVVATGTGGVPEIVEDTVTGLLVPPADAVALARAVGALLADPARAHAMGRAGRRRVETCFNHHRHARLVEAVWTEVIGAPVERARS